MMFITKKALEAEKEKVRTEMAEKRYAEERIAFLERGFRELADRICRLEGELVKCDKEKGEDNGI